MRPTFLALLTGLAGLTLAPYPSAPATASCAAPSLSIEGHGSTRQRLNLVRGEEVTVNGRGFVDGCADVGGGSVLGCSGEGSEEVETPLQDVELVVAHGRPTPKLTTLAVSDAATAEDGQLGRVSWTFQVPDSLALGSAVLQTSVSAPLRVRIVPVVIVD